MHTRPLKLPLRFAATVFAVGALQGCPENERCVSTYTVQGALTSAACVDDAGCYHYVDDAGQPLFTDCRSPGACSSVRTYPDGATGGGGNYC